MFILKYVQDRPPDVGCHLLDILRDAVTVTLVFNYTHEYTSAHNFNSYIIDYNTPFQVHCFV